LSDDIAWEKTRAEERVRREKRGWAALDRMTRWRLKLGWLIDHLRHRRAGVAGGRALEVGCGAATRIPEGAIPYGIEVSSELARQASPLYEARGGKVIHAPAAHAIEEFPDAFFDNIIMRSYLEHEAQPRLVLERAFAKLKPGGKISLRLPNFGSINRFVMRKNWCGFRFPDHVNYFTPRTLRKLGESVGYEFRWLNRLSLFDDNIIAELRKPMH
jgi:SAM-dependent methyltransferase